MARSRINGQGEMSHAFGSPGSAVAMAATLPTQPGMAPQRLARRDVRVVLLVTLVLLMCSVDLAVTLNYLTTAGFNEANPLARWIMEFNCAWVLAAWKLLLMAITGGLLIFTRKHLSGEIGAWLCLVVMIWLMVRWHAYSDSAHRTAEFRYGTEHANAEFVRFDANND